MEKSRERMRDKVVTEEREQQCASKSSSTELSGSGGGMQVAVRPFMPAVFAAALFQNHQQAGLQ